MNRLTDDKRDVLAAMLMLKRDDFAESETNYARAAEILNEAAPFTVTKSNVYNLLKRRRPDLRWKPMGAKDAVLVKN